MKLNSPLVLLLAATAAAATSENETSGSETQSKSAPSASSTPAVVPGFKWSDPYNGDGAALPSVPSGFRATCETVATFAATEHLLRDLKKPLPLGLSPWAESLKTFFGGRPYPGSWDGADISGLTREVIVMEYKAVPKAVRDWIDEKRQEEEGNDKYLFGVYGKPRKSNEKILRQAKIGEHEDHEKIILFAPGALYEILPLWVAEGSGCDGEQQPSSTLGDKYILWEQ
jgi:hypothetical protein